MPELSDDVLDKSDIQLREVQLHGSAGPVAWIGREFNVPVGRRVEIQRMSIFGGTARSRVPLPELFWLRLQLVGTVRAQKVSEIQREDGVETGFKFVGVSSTQQVKLLALLA